jgi:ParB/RepB/Spo0J family partition protein
MSTTKKKPIHTISGLIESGKIVVPQNADEKNSRLPTFSSSRPTSGLLDSTKATSSKNIVQAIKLGLLRPSPYNARKFRSESRIEEISSSLAIDGQREPITVYPGQGSDEGYYLILSGVTRFLAATALKWDTLSARIDDSFRTDDALALLRASHLHNDSSPETDLDHAVIMEELSRYGYVAEEIAKALGYNSKRKVFRLKHFSRLPPQIYDLASANPEKIYSNIAEALTKAVEELGEDMATELANEMLSKNFGLQQLQHRIETEMRKRDRNQGIKTRARKEMDIPVRLGNVKVGHFSVLSIPLSKNKRVQFVAELPEKLAEVFAERAESLMSELRSMSEEGL